MFPKQSLHEDFAALLLLLFPALAELRTANRVRRELRGITPLSCFGRPPCSLAGDTWMMEGSSSIHRVSVPIAWQAGEQEGGTEGSLSPLGSLLLIVSPLACHHPSSFSPQSFSQAHMVPWAVCAHQGSQLRDFSCWPGLCECITARDCTALSI